MLNTDFNKISEKSNYNKFHPVILPNSNNIHPNSHLENKGRFGITTTEGGFRSKSSNKRDEFCIFNKLNKRDMSGIDNEKLQDIILQLKKESNQKTNEIN